MGNIHIQDLGIQDTPLTGITDFGTKHQILEKIKAAILTKPKIDNLTKIDKNQQKQEMSLYNFRSTFPYGFKTPVYRNPRIRLSESLASKLFRGRRLLSGLPSQIHACAEMCTNVNELVFCRNVLKSRARHPRETSLPKTTEPKSPAATKAGLNILKQSSTEPLCTFSA